MRFLYIICFLLGFSLNIYAQTVDNTGAELIKRFKATLAESRKQKSTPILPPLDPNAGKKLDYLVPEYPSTVKYPDPKIHPLPMSGNKELKSYGFYSKIGIGYPISPLVELSYHNKASDLVRFGTNFKHHSSAGNLENQNFSNTYFDLGGTYFAPNTSVAVGGKLGFQFDNYCYYGYHALNKILPDSLNIFPDHTDIPKDSINQQFFDFFGSAHLFNYKSNNAQLNYGAHLDFHILSDAHAAREIVLAPHIQLDKWMGRSSNKHRFFTDLDIHYASFNNDTTGTNRYVINFHPGVELNFGTFKARLGTNLGSSEDKFFIFPDVKMNLNIANGKFNVYTAWIGEIKTNTFKSLTNYNPFLQSEIELRHTRFSEIAGGLKGNISKIGYDFRIGYAITKDIPLFLNDTRSNYLRFSPIYDSLNVLSVKGSLDIKAIENLTILGSLGYNIYTGGHQSKAYHLPIFESNFSLLYKIQALELKAELFVNAGVPYLNRITGEDAMLTGLFDLNFGASYWLGKKDKQNFGFFLDVNNILNNKYQRWHLYPQLGINAKIGILAKF